MNETPATPLHVVHVISGLGQGGAETVLFRLVTATSPAIRHTVVSLTDEGVFGPRLRAAGVDVRLVSLKGAAALFRGFPRLVRTLRHLRPDVVQTWMYHADLLGGIAARLAGCPRVVWGIRNSGADLHHGSRSARIFARLCAVSSRRIPAAIVACAHDAARRHQGWGYDHARMHVIPNGYDLSRWTPDPSMRVAMRDALGLPGDALVVGSVARWNPLKDHENLLQALSVVAPEFPTLRCVLVGDGIAATNTALTALANRFGVADRLLLLGRRHDVPAILQALDLHVLSSRAEGFPNVVAEAMAAGVPGVVTDAGDAAAIVGHEGWVVPVRQPAALAAALRTALGTVGSAEYAGRSGRGRDRVRRQFSLDAMVASYENLWRSVARGGGIGPAAAGRGGNEPDAVSLPPRRLLFVVNNPAFFLSHRLPVALQARGEGYDVHVATMAGDAVDQITAHGFTHHVLPLSRSGRNPVQELRSLWSMIGLFRRVDPVLVHAVTIKPVIYGGLAARLVRVPAFVAAVSGLGYVFMAGGPAHNALRAVVTCLYRWALGHPNSRVIFQNTADRDVLQHAGVVRSEQVVLIRGSGVDLAAFPCTAEPPGPPVAVLVARLLADKGVREFVQAARLTRGDASGVRWVMVGAPDPGNPASVTTADIEAWRAEGAVELLGERRDIAAVYAQSHIAVLPSYREGLPKSLVEAAACGRAVVTTDVPGCRDAIEPGVSGLLVPVRDAGALAQAVVSLARDGQRREAMGRAGRHLAEQAFDIRRVVQAHLDVYRQLVPGD